MNIIKKYVTIYALLLALPLQGCVTAYSAKAIEARVIDADTHQPVEGANVVAHWVLHFGLEGGQQTDLMLIEAVTDKDGRFYFPAWGPQSIPSRLPWDARMKNRDPAIIIFKPGYQWVGLSNEITGPYPDRGPALRSSRWHGKTIELKKFDGDLRRYGLMVSGALSGVSWGGCNWKKIPRIMVSLNKEAERLSLQKIFHGIPTFKRLENTAEGENCGSVQEFFNEHLK